MAAVERRTIKKSGRFSQKAPERALLVRVTVDRPPSSTEIIRLLGI